MTKCDSTQIIRFSLIMRYHINAEWKIWNSAVHNPDTVWFNYCQLHLSSFRSWRDGICCAATSLMRKIKISFGKRFAGIPWVQGGNSVPKLLGSASLKKTCLEPWKSLQWEGESLLNILLAFCTWGVQPVILYFLHKLSGKVCRARWCSRWFNAFESTSSLAIISNSDNVVGS